MLEKVEGGGEYERGGYTEESFTLITFFIDWRLSTKTLPQGTAAINARGNDHGYCGVQMEALLLFYDIEARQALVFGLASE